ncbi:DUF1987 domain-containing protein [Salibacteraceae bacterium]|jgi:hypothetical protein|nr:DUF1987 domain-containing protein [Salibacteraceae bacterium]MDB4104123.1 DUF1987 domain-containing protein [Salibacteraceae bacterium]MDB9708500.1 DUF1987 domain-containing protein [Salibacteraceae bacterium]MDC1220299.1 DUF1987 domain-containing protein [bacterium]MDC1304106.1 DUF1987 domain-containing protein [Salibacteraceae bacterium]
MDPIKIEGTPKTPTVNFDAESGILEVKGRSIPENAVEFYKPLVDWIGNYGDNSKSDTVVNIQLEYFNTSSSKCILDVFKKLESVNGKTTITINWHYEEDDEDMLEAGEDYQAIINIPFKMIEMEEM